MKLVLIPFFILLALHSPGQENYSYADEKALQIPAQLTYSADSIARYFNSQFNKDGEKIRAAYTWIINNIKYSKDSMFHFNWWGIDPVINLEAVLRRRKGVCENYASLYNSILLKCHIQSVVITGYTNFRENDYWNGHAWTAVQLDNEWYLCDPTWDASYASYLYFMVPPAAFIHTHIPFDPLWQMLDHPITHRDFRKNNFTPKKNSSIFYYKDSVAAYLRSDTLVQMQDALRRMNATGFESRDEQTWYAYNQMKVHIVLQEENMQLYNEAVNNLNKAKKLYNQFIQYRNNRFMPLQSNTDIHAVLAEAISLIDASYKKMIDVGKKTENFQYDTEALEKNLNNLSAKIREQQAFLKKYFETAEADRVKLFTQ